MHKHKMKGKIPQDQEQYFCKRQRNKDVYYQITDP